MQIAEIRWVADGLEAGEVEPAQRLVDLALWFPEVFAMAVKQEWLRDNVTGDEKIALASIRWLSYYGDGLPTAISRMPWFGDGITADEATVIQNLYWMVRTDDEDRAEELLETAQGILDMPFLESVEGPEAQAVRSLRRLARADVARFLEIIAHPKIADGIDDEEAKIVALLYGTNTYRPESVEVLLRGSGVYLQERTIDLPLSGEMLLTIIRVRDQVTPTMEFLEHAVRNHEDFMGVPFPTNYIAYYFDDAVLATAGGQHFGTHIASKLQYDVVNGHSWWRTPVHMAHEVGHYYWTGSSQGWITEGAADLLGGISERARVEAPLEPRKRPCASAQTISDLEKLGGEGIDDRKLYRCNYPLGERLFLDLYHALGDEAFRKAFRDLYLKSQTEDYSDDCEGTALGICHLVAAFKADVSEADAAKVDEIIERWYGPLP